MPIAVNLNGIVFPRPSAYRFVAAVDGADVKELPFRVQTRAPEPPAVTMGGYL